jgi:hypothetical protein
LSRLTGVRDGFARFAALSLQKTALAKPLALEEKAVSVHAMNTSLAGGESHSATSSSATANRSRSATSFLTH